MIAVAGLFGLTLLVLIVFNAAIHALPVFIGMSLGAFALHSGAGALGAVAIGVATGMFVTAFGRELASSARIGPAVALLFVGFAGLAGYQVGATVAALSGATSAWAPVFGALGAVVVGGTTCRRLCPIA